MRQDDWQSTCIALIRCRLGGDGVGRLPEPAAVGRTLERGRATIAEVAAWCASLAYELGPTALLVDQETWMRSDALRALLHEYRTVQALGVQGRAGHACPVGRPGRAASGSSGWARSCRLRGR